MYPYYAGYADAFVETMIDRLDTDGGTLLDPWNGAGTTTAAAALSGIASVGIDLNPAALLIARARLLSSDVVESLQPLTEEVIGNLKNNAELQMDADPLTAWFAPHSIITLRAIERSVCKLLVDPNSRVPGDMAAINTSFSSLAALFYVALFRTVRSYLADFKSTNPTWLHESTGPDDRLSILRSDIIRVFRHECKHLEEKVRQYKLSYEGKCPASLSLGSSESLRLPKNSIDGVITSPPYCTRIDYVVATAPELAVLGMGKAATQDLRKKMLGTPVMNRLIWSDAFSDDRSPLCSDRAEKLLQYVQKHKSHGSSNYYHPFYAQYFYGMEQSLGEIGRVSRAGAPTVFVVQDSYFKKKRIDLASILREMGEAQGWDYLRSFRYEVRTRAAQNPLSRRYGRRQATETAIVFSINK